MTSRVFLVFSSVAICTLLVVASVVFFYDLVAGWSHEHCHTYTHTPPRQTHTQLTCVCCALMAMPGPPV